MAERQFVTDYPYSLDRVLAPLTRQAFLETYFERRHLVVYGHAPDRFADLLSFDEVDRVISTMGLASPEITVTKPHEGDDRSEDDSDNDAGHSDRDSGPAPSTLAAGRIDPVRVARDFAAGGTVILRALHERLPALARFTRSLEATLSARVQTNIYLTPAHQQGFRAHFDTHDVLILQIEGTKEWRIYDSPVSLPLPDQGYTPGSVQIGAETDRFVLSPGDVAYIPRGLAHDAVATGTRSLHITTGLMFRTWADVAAEALRVAAHDDVSFRRALPPGFAQPGADLAAHEATLRGLLTKLADQAPVEALMTAFQTQFVADRVPRSERYLTEIARAEDLDGAARIAARPDLIFALSRQGGPEGTIDLSVHGNVISFPPQAESALRFVLASDGVKVADLPGPLDLQGKLVLVRRLIRDGLLYIR
ncbi:MAG: cupin domain-containing protein [Pseudomonadota bacterium]